MVSAQARARLFKAVGWEAIDEADRDFRLRVLVCSMARYVCMLRMALYVK